MRRFILALIMLVPFVGLVYAGWKLFEFHGGEASAYSIQNFADGGERPFGERITLTGGGLTWGWSGRAGDPDDPAAYWMAYVPTTPEVRDQLREAQAGGAGYPLSSLLLVKVSPEVHDERFTQPYGEWNLIVAADLKGVLLPREELMPSAGWFRMRDVLGETSMDRVSAFDINGSPRFIKGMNALALMSGLLAIPCFVGLMGLATGKPESRAAAGGDA